MPNGKGVHYYINGDKYEGEFKDDEKSDKGIFYCTNDDRDGRGTYYCVDDSRYE